MSGSSGSDDDYIPELPPHLTEKQTKPQTHDFKEVAPCRNRQSKTTSSFIGPQIPSHISRTQLESFAEAAQQQEAGIRSDETGEDDDDVVGPYLPDDPRSRMIPQGNVVKPKENAPTKREEWMLMCPKERSLAVGLGPRKFLGRTPDELVFDKDEEDDEGNDNFLDTARAELANKSKQERDQQMEELMNKAESGSTKESLLSIHRKRKLAEDAAKSKDAKERRPFDRDVDLKVGGLSDADKEKYIKKSQELSSRFSGGKQKFL